MKATCPLRALRTWSARTSRGARLAWAALLTGAALTAGCGQDSEPRQSPASASPAADATGGAAPPGHPVGVEPPLFEAWPVQLAPMTSGRAGSPTILEVNGGGAACFDADGDGDMDLLLVIPGGFPAGDGPSGGANRLYRNDAGSFRDVTPDSGVDLPGFCNGVAVADVDSDGLRDVFVTRLGPDALLRNLGGLRFEALPQAGGAAGDAWGTSAVFADIDRDGDLDLYVCAYLEFDPGQPPLHGRNGMNCLWQNRPVMCGPQGLPPQPDRYWRNDDGRFTDATAETGFAAPAAYALGCVDGDFNEDGWPDIYVSNDSMPNALFLSQGDGRVAEAGVLSGAALSARGREQAGMGIAAGDATGDLREDLLVTNFSLESNAFYVSLGEGRFDDRADATGLGGPSRMLLGWGTAFLDADLDGQLDLVVANGHVYVQADEPGTGTSWAQPAHLWLRDGAGRFRLAEWVGSVAEPWRALAIADLDDDGVTDLLLTRLGRSPLLLRGLAPAETALRVEVRGPPGNPDGLGTVLRLSDAQGERIWRVRNSGGYQAVHDPRAVFAYRGPGVLSARLPDGRSLQTEVTGPGKLVLEWPTR